MKRSPLLRERVEDVECPAENARSQALRKFLNRTGFPVEQYRHYKSHGTHGKQYKERHKTRSIYLKRIRQMHRLVERLPILYIHMITHPT